MPTTTTAAPTAASGAAGAVEEASQRPSSRRDSSAREWADEFLLRVRRLQRFSPPSAQLPIIFTHIPKCAGSTFRNQLLLEFTRLHRARHAERFACVLYRDVSFRERNAAAEEASSNDDDANNSAAPKEERSRSKGNASSAAAARGGGGGEG